MKRTLLLTLTALLLLSSMTACGSKSEDTNNEDGYSRVLYSDDSSEEETKQIATTNDSDTNIDTDTESDSSKSEKDTSTEKESDSDTEKKSSESKPAESKAENSSKSDKKTSSAQTNSKKSTTISNNNTSSVSSATNNNNNNNTTQTTTSSESNSQQNTQVQSTVSENEQSETESSQTEVSSQPEEDNSQVQSEPQNSDGVFTEDDLICVINGSEIHLADNIKEVTAKFGEPFDIISAPSCKYVGFEDKTYIYDGFTVNTYPNEDGSVDYVVGIEVTADSYETQRGVKIGTSLEDVFSAYGEGYETVGNTYRYSIGDKILSIYTENDSVAGISFLYNAP